MNENMTNLHNAIDNLCYGNAEDMFGDFLIASDKSFDDYEKASARAQEYHEIVSGITNSKLFLDGDAAMNTALDNVSNGLDKALEESFDDYLAYELNKALVRACRTWLDTMYTKGTYMA